MRIVIRTLCCIPLLCSTAWAVEQSSTAVPLSGTEHSTTAVINQTTQVIKTVANQTAQVVKVAATANTSTAIPNANAAPTTTDTENKPLTAEQIAKQKALNDAKVKALVKDQATRLQELEKANLDALSQNQELQLKNDNLGVQIEVLQSERSAQMFIYGAATIAVGIFCGFLMASYIYTKRRRQW
ncbi:hypothetical protein [Acinetobacter shaoyimingii]|uniref:SH3 domain protein n=1 Tax=Acinetobacter shaoyimingii TaxID=2715164 RepID=A0A6G8RYN9_9GAMM|nr:hypothetical protein [Acinetobacter shaoyimingii]NHB58791.1 hypothetical protein [Acinetobacter shaoyimingii]QIO06918.1 hypothetical protein G8E00_13675 [Acinetobacter shaoyimingii]